MDSSKHSHEQLGAKISDEMNLTGRAKRQSNVHVLTRDGYRHLAKRQHGLHTSAALRTLDFFPGRHANGNRRTESPQEGDLRGHG